MSQLRDALFRQEGMRLKPYLDTRGYLTIGVGRCLDFEGISESEALLMLDNDIARIHAECEKAFPWLSSLSEARQDVIFNIVFNVGLRGFLGFKKTIAAIEQGDFEVAARELLASEWSKQVKGRALELAQMMRTGQY